MIQELLNALFQLAVFSAIPFLWWLIGHRKKAGFFAWIGLKRAKGDWRVLVGVMAAFFGICVAMQLWIVPLLLPPGTSVQQQYAGQGAGALVSILIFGMIQTGLSEEILFRGFLLKRLSARFGTARATLIQAAVFGTLHGVGFFIMTTPPKALVIFFLTGFCGWMLGYLNEKKFGGSILPSYLCHGVGNVLISALSAFSLL